MILAKVCFLMNWIESKKFGILRCYIHVMFLSQGSYGERTTFEHWAKRDTESNIILRSSDNQVFHEKRVSTFSLLSNVWNQILKRSLNSFLWNLDFAFLFPDDFPGQWVETVFHYYPNLSTNEQMLYQKDWSIANYHQTRPTISPNHHH